MFSHSHDSEVWRVLTYSDMGNVIQGWGGGVDCRHLSTPPPLKRQHGNVDCSSGMCHDTQFFKAVKVCQVRVHWQSQWSLNTVLGRTRGEGCAVCGCCSCHVGVYEVKPRDVGSGEAVRPQEDVLRADVGYETGTTLYKALGNGVSGWANLQVGGCAREVRPVPSSQLGSWSSAHLYGVGCNMSACPETL